MLARQMRPDDHAESRVKPRRLVVAPFAEELAGIAAVLSRVHQRESVPGLRLDAEYLPALGTLLATGGHGKSQFAVQTQYLLSCFPSVELVICAGAAGRLDPTLRVGDVVVATETVEHDFSVLMVSRPLPRFPTDPKILEEMRTVAGARERRFRVVLDAIASGDIDCVDAEQGRAIRAKTAAACVAWEGAGARRAARFNRVGSVEIRAISDGADDTAGRDFNENLECAMGCLGELLLDYLEHTRVPS